MKYIGLFLVFLLFSMVFTDIVVPFGNAMSLFVPIDPETGVIIIIKIVFTTGIHVIFLNLVSKLVDEQFAIFNYVLTRGNTKQIIWKMLGYAKKNIAVFVILMALAILVFSRINGLENINIFVYLMISLFLTVLIWYMLFILLKQWRVSSKIIFLLLTFITTILMMFSENFPLSTLILPGSSAFLENPSVWLRLKILLLIILIAMIWVVLKNFECLGVKIDD